MEVRTGPVVSTLLLVFEQDGHEPYRCEFVRKGK